MASILGCGMLPVCSRRSEVFSAEYSLCILKTAEAASVPAAERDAAAGAECGDVFENDSEAKLGACDLQCYRADQTINGKRSFHERTKGGGGARRLRRGTPDCAGQQ